MPFLGTVGGSNEAKGQGGYHPGQSPVDGTGSSAAGSLGTTAVSGNASSPSASTVTGQRVAIDPFYQGAITYSLASGALPPGFSLNSSNGVVTGSYTVAGTNFDGTVYTFTVRATTSGIPSYTDRTYTITLSVPFLYRQVITRNYMVGGYQNSNLWSNANRTTHSNDTSVNLGDGCVDNYHYKSGGSGDTYGYIWNGNSTTRFNLRTESKQNGTGAPGYGCANTGSAGSADRTKIYTCGSGVGTMFKFNIPTETFSNLGVAGTGSDTSAMQGEFISMHYDGSTPYQTTFSTDTVVQTGVNGGASGQQKGLSGKIGYGYGGDQGGYNAGYTFRKINLTTTSSSDTGARPGKILSNTGEENYGMGQLYGYCIGSYDNTQNNRAGKYIFSSDTPQEINGSLQPGGHGGASSGFCFNRD
jgi:hypothetical protein